MENRYPQRESGGGGGQEVVPIRTCISCRARRSQEELVRMSSLDGAIEVQAGKYRQRRGRGAYVCPIEACIEQVLAKGRLTRALRIGSQPIDSDEIRSALKRVLEQENKIGD